MEFINKQVIKSLLPSIHDELDQRKENSLLILYPIGLIQFLNQNILNFVSIDQLTVIHPRAGVPGTGAPSSSEKVTPAPVAHAQVAQHHVELRPHALVDHYVPDHAQPVISATSTFSIFTA